MKYYLVAGERSGDLHASNLMKEIKELDPSPVFRFWGGDMMKAQGGELVYHYKDMALMGFWEVFKGIFRLSNLLKYCNQDILDFQPDALVLIDFSGFNMKIAKRASQNGIRVYYYIAPKTWAWNQGRTNNIRKYVSRLYAILPFETSFFESYGVDVKYVGNPLVEVVEDFKKSKLAGSAKDQKLVAILPGSRRQEVSMILDRVIVIAKQFQGYTFVVAGVDNLDESVYEPVKKQKNIDLVFDKTYALLSSAHAAIVTSGTATLETALFGTPQVVCYRTSPISYWIGRMVIKVDYISLVNLILDRPLVKELVQDDLNAQSLSKELNILLTNQSERQRISQGYEEIKTRLGNNRAAKNTAKDIVEQLRLAKRL